MKYSTKVSDAVHIMIFIYLNPSQDLASTAIAKSIMTNPSYVRQIMAQLKKFNLLHSIRGQANPALTRGVDAITLLDVYRAIEGEKPLLHMDTHTNPECGVGVNIQLALSDYYLLVQSAAENKMMDITLKDIIDTYYDRIKRGEGLEEQCT